MQVSSMDRRVGFSKLLDERTEGTLVIIPTYNERENVERMIERLFSLYPKIHLLFIDDGSPDGTGEFLKEQQKTYSCLNLIQRKGKQGLASAYITGFRYAIEKKFSYVIEMDCDFSHDPRDVGSLLEKVEPDNALVIGSRYVNGIRIINWPFKRLFLSYMASVYIRHVTGMPLFDVTGGFKCFKREALENIDLDKIVSSGYVFQFELNYKLWSKKYKIEEVPIVFTEREKGVSKMDGSIIFEAFFTVLRLRFMKMLGKLQ